MTTLDETTPDPSVELSALQTVIAALQPLPPEVQRKILQSAATFLQIDYSLSTVVPAGRTPPSHSASPGYPAFSDNTSMSPKDFLLEKQPRTDVERVACLAFYLTHYRDTPHFKTLDLSKLNTEAAQPKFSNAANAANNAVKMGYLVPSTKGQRQLSAAGEQFVQSLPDRAAARAVMTHLRPRKRTRRTASTTDKDRG
jgi:hypothetical protein